MNIGSRAVQHAGLLAALVLVAATASPAERTAELEPVRAAAERGHARKALRQLDKILDRDSELLEGRLLRGLLLVELGRGAEAEEAFRELAGRIPERPEPRNNLAVLQAAAGRVDDAVAALAELVGKYPGYADAAANLETLRARSTGGGGPTAIAGGPRPRLLLTAELGSYAPAEPRSNLSPEPSRPSAALAGEPDEAAAPEVVAAPETPATELAPEPAAEPNAEPAAEPDAESGAEPIIEVAAPEPEPAPGMMPGAAGAPPPEPAAQPSASDLGEGTATALRGEIAGVVRAWAAAWSQQRVKEYLAFYAADFEPTGYGSRQAWERTRRQRVAAPAFIEVEIDLDAMKLRQTDRGEVEVTFTQRYRSDRFGDTVEKTLTLTREAGAWRIRRETSR